MRRCAPASIMKAGDSAVREMLADIAAVTGKDTILKESDIEYLTETVNAAIVERGEDTSDTTKVIRLSSHALSGMGDSATARRLLVFGSGIVRNSQWEFSGDSTLWTLDLKKLLAGSGVPTELTVFQGLNRILETIQDVWEQTSGRGTLGLRHVLSTADVLFRKTSEKQRRSFSNEIIRHCEDTLTVFASRRHWEHVPKVVNLDAV